MKNLFLITLFTSVLVGCVITPAGGIVTVKPSPNVQISYYWDDHRSRYYYVDSGRRVYMPHDWYDHRHPHGGPPGQRKKHKHKYNYRD